MPKNAVKEDTTRTENQSFHTLIELSKNLTKNSEHNEEDECAYTNLHRGSGLHSDIECEEEECWNSQVSWGQAALYNINLREEEIKKHKNKGVNDGGRHVGLHGCEF